MKEKSIVSTGLRRLVYTYNGNTSYSTTSAGFSYLDMVIAPTGKVTHPLIPKPHRYRLRYGHGLRGEWRFWAVNQPQYTYKYDGVFATGSISGIPDELLPDANLLYSRALERLNVQVRGRLDLSVSAFQYRLTKQMLEAIRPRNLIRSAQQLSRVIQRTAKGDKTPLSLFYDSTRKAGDWWLVYQYGWRPLMLDIYGSLDEKLRVLDNSLAGFVGTASSQLNERYAYPQSMSLDTVKKQGIERCSGKRACKIGVVLDMGISEHSRLARWSSLNPASIAWELLPYSFVVDWFYDIGGYLRSLETAVAYSLAFKRGYVTTLTAYEGSAYIDFGSNTRIGGYIYAGKIQGYYKYVFMNRSVLTAYPSPVKPSLTIDLHSSALLSAAALLRQLLPDSPGDTRGPKPRYSPPVLDRRGNALLRNLKYR